MIGRFVINEMKYTVKMKDIKVLFSKVKAVNWKAGQMNAV